MPVREHDHGLHDPLPPASLTLKVIRTTVMPTYFRYDPESLMNKNDSRGKQAGHLAGESQPTNGSFRDHRTLSGTTGTDQACRGTSLST